MGIAKAKYSISAKPEILWWKINEGSGTILQDSTDNRYSGYLDATWSDGVIAANKSLAFNSTSNDAGSNGAITFGANILTVCCWFKKVSGPSSDRIIFESSADFNNNDQSFTTYYDYTNNRIYCGIRGTVGAYYVDYCSAPPSDTWAHLAVVFDRSYDQPSTIFYGRLKIYVNGVLQSVTNTYNNMVNTATTFTANRVFLGSRGGGTPFFGGYIDDFRIYNRELTIGEIEQVVKDPQ
jgi:hypothetical protein